MGEIVGQDNNYVAPLSMDELIIRASVLMKESWATCID